MFLHLSYINFILLLLPLYLIIANSFYITLCVPSVAITVGDAGTFFAVFMISFMGFALSPGEKNGTSPVAGIGGGVTLPSTPGRESSNACVSFTLPAISTAGVQNGCIVGITNHPLLDLFLVSSFNLKVDLVLARYQDNR
jgi:hypothetical protein